MSNETQTNTIEFCADARQLHEMRAALKGHYYVVNPGLIKLTQVKRCLSLTDFFWITIAFYSNTSLTTFLMDAGKLAVAHKEYLISKGYYRNTRVGKSKLSLLRN